MEPNKNCCPQLEHALHTDNVPLIEVKKYREIGIRGLNGGTSYIDLFFCPWCSARLPSSVRSQWFEELKRRNIDPYGDCIPCEFLDERWYEQLHL